MSPSLLLSRLRALVFALALLPALLLHTQTHAMEVKYKTVQVEGLNIFYREAGPTNAPTILLLHGFPTSSQMYRNLIPTLANRYHVVAPDYPGFGQSSMPTVQEFSYTFDNLAHVVERFTEALGLRAYSLYVMDYGAPVGFRLATWHPERVQALIVQNGNAYEEGLQEFWNPFRAYWNEPSDANREVLRGFLTADVTRLQYVSGARDVSSLSPDTWTLDQARLDRPGNQEVQLALFYDYRTNVALYPQWQQYLRTHQPPTLIVWGRNDFIFPASGAWPFLRDVPRAELYLLDTGHFALEEDVNTIASLMRRFLKRNMGW